MASTLNVFYHDMAVLRTKTDEFMSNLVTTKLDIVCITETWLCNGISNSNYFTPNYKVYRKDRDYLTTGQKLGGGVLIAAEASLSSHRRFDVESYSECVWFEIKPGDGLRYLIGNYYFLPLFDQFIFVEHPEALQNHIDFGKYRVQIYGDFNLPGVDWTVGHVNSNNLITQYKATCLLESMNLCGLDQLNTIENSAGNIPDLVLSNASGDYVTPILSPMVQTDLFHPPFTVEIFLPRKRPVPSTYTTHCYHKGDYLNMYKYFQSFD